LAEREEYYLTIDLAEVRLEQETRRSPEVTGDCGVNDHRDEHDK
jgi:hypothetical protein